MSNIIVSQTPTKSWDSLIKPCKDIWMLWRRKAQLAPIFLPGQSGQRTLVGSPWAPKVMNHNWWYSMCMQRDMMICFDKYHNNNQHLVRTLFISNFPILVFPKILNITWLSHRASIISFCYVSRVLENFTILSPDTCIQAPYSFCNSYLASQTAASVSSCWAGS